MSDPLRRPGQTLKNLAIGAIAVVILYNLAFSIIAPYFPLIGKVVAGAVIVVIVVGVIAFLINMLRRMGVSLPRGGIRRGR